jgi:pSer/pThr/pTyr-binding forkhead associated (FHA) protein
MAKLCFKLDGKSLGEFELDKERVTIGRRPSNDIHIDNLAVSGEHAMILTLGSDSFLEDLNSTNGTMVNKKVVKKHVLQHKDIIEFGKYQLQYMVDNQPKKTNNDESDQLRQTKRSAPDNSIVISRSMPQIGLNSKVVSQVAQETNKFFKTSEVGSQPIRSDSGRAHLLILNGTREGQHLSLNRAMLKLGEPGGSLALITKRSEGHFLTHVEGEVRASVNDKPTGALALKLNNHDVIELSGIKMEVILA